MRTEYLLLQTNREVKFLIGTSDVDNFLVIDSSDPEDIWFHVDGKPSCHVVAELKELYNTTEMTDIIQHGALLCKNQHTKYKMITRLPIIYTEIKNIKKTKKAGAVLTQSVTKIIV